MPWSTSAPVLNFLGGTITTLDDWNDDNRYRLGCFLAGGLGPEKATALVEFVRQIEAGQDPKLVGERRMTIFNRLVEEGMDRYTASAAMLCLPSPSAPYAEIGNGYLAGLGEL